MKTLRLILGDQLNENHSWFRAHDPDFLYVMMEVRQETDCVLHHVQKLIGFFQAMRLFADTLRNKGLCVVYLRIGDTNNRQSFAANLAWLTRKYKIERFEYMAPDDQRLDRELAGIARDLGLPWSMVGSEHFLTERDEYARLFSGRKRKLMETFYRAMRKKHGILMRGDQPESGRWNYDADNRGAWRGNPPLPAMLSCDNDCSAVYTDIRKAGLRFFGNVDAAHFSWPVTREQALERLRIFARKRLAHFGRFQDAMTVQSKTLFHSCLSFALNVKLLHPGEVLDAALEQWRKGAAGLDQVEGFVRQILGWREFMRGVYWAHAPDYLDLNYFEHKRPLPDWFWTGETDMNCLAQAIGQSLDTAYAHHIQRLMLIGNYALLAGLDVDAVDRWYLGIYIDAVPWVEAPNTRGMSQFADGGLVATKPYVSTASYIHKMSDYCKTCRYDRKKRHGDGACPFNSLYWHFFERHRDKLQHNPRIAMAYRNLARMSAGERKAVFRWAEKAW